MESGYAMDPQTRAPGPVFFSRPDRAVLVSPSCPMTNKWYGSTSQRARIAGICRPRNRLAGKPTARVQVYPAYLRDKDHPTAELTAGKLIGQCGKLIGQCDNDLQRVEQVGMAAG